MQQGFGGCRWTQIFSNRPCDVSRRIAISNSSPGWNASSKRDASRSACCFTEYSAISSVNLVSSSSFSASCDAFDRYLSSDKLLIVTQAREVREVLERFDDFTLGESIEPGMPWGNFLMTVDWRQRHAQERQWLQSAVDPADPARLRAIVDQRCRQQIAAANGHIDVVSELLEPVVVDIADKYFGVPPLAGSTRDMAHAMRDLAGIIMVKPPIGSEPWSRSRSHIAKITDLVLSEIASAASGGGSHPTSPGDTLLTRFVQRLGTSDAPAWFDQDWIRRYLTGLLATGGATIVRAAAGAIDQILAHPDALQEAQKVAIELDQAMGRGDEERVNVLRTTLRHFVYEALRFRPMLPLLVRDTPHDTVIAYGTKKARLVRAGTRVLAPPLSAMFDREAVPDPSSFDANATVRPVSAFWLWGAGVLRTIHSRNSHAGGFQIASAAEGALTNNGREGSAAV